MSRTRIHNLAISLDGFATREPQSCSALRPCRPAPARLDVRHPVLGAAGRPRWRSGRGRISGGRPRVRGASRPRLRLPGRPSAIPIESLCRLGMVSDSIDCLIEIVLCALLMAAFCYFTQSFGNLLFPQSKAVFTAIGLLSTLEITLPLWLLMKGVNIEQWKKRALAAA